jgi:hypothetical protein
MHKPIDEYYLHDNGDGNGWEVASCSPGKFSIVTTPDVNEHNGVIELKLTQYFTGIIGSTTEEHFMLSPEEAFDLASMLQQAYITGESYALGQRDKKDSCLSKNSS